jgi:anti-anti-sigma factor
MSEGEIFVFEQIEDVLVLTPIGDLFQYRFEALRSGYNDTYRKLMDESIKHLLIDFQSVGHFGSAFIGMLIKLAKAVRTQGGEAALCGLTPDMKDVLDNLMLLENVKTDFFWVPLPSRAEALEFLKSKAAQ